jgi:hypothetical protein
MKHSFSGLYGEVFATNVCNISRNSGSVQGLYISLLSTNEKLRTFMESMVSPL